MSPRTTRKHSTPVDDEIASSTDMQRVADSTPMSGPSELNGAITLDSNSVALFDEHSADPGVLNQSIQSHENDSATDDSQAQAKVDLETQTDIGHAEPELPIGGDLAQNDSDAPVDVDRLDSTVVLENAQREDHSNREPDQPNNTWIPAGEQAAGAGDVTQTSAPSLPDPSSISDRLRSLVVAVGQVEELSRQAREAAASDLALYNGIAASQRQFEEGFAEAQRIGHEAGDVYKRAFGREAKAVAEPAVVEAREVEQAFAELTDAWRQQAELFLSEHPDVESLLAEQRQQDEEAHRRQIARTKAERFQQLANGTDAALRQNLLDDARDCLRMLGNEFPTEADRVKPLRDRLQQRIRAANDAAARRVLVQASELQGRGDFHAAVRLLEAVDVQGLSREASEDVFGRWSAACSLLAQTRGLDLLRWSPAQGRGVMIYEDASVPYGAVEFSPLGMGPSHFEGRVISAADREGALIISRARPFRAAELPAELSAAWYGRSYVTSGGSPAAPVRH